MNHSWYRDLRAWKFFLSLAAAAFAAILFRLFLRRGDRARSMEESAKRRRVCENDGTARGASSTHASTEGQEVASSSRYDYEVFLSFRGPDTRAGFTDFLYITMIHMGIRVYKDDKDLPKGEEFGPELLQAIEQSKILMPIFSKGYASSVWCLKELAKMVECQKTKGQKIIPIFYDVVPSVVRYQTGIYAEAFRSHEEKQRYGKDNIREWKAALSAVGAINGWELPRDPTRREGECVQTITQEVFNELKKASLVVSNYLVGVDHHVDKIMEMIGAWTSETRIIGITGMGGIGKTTIAKIIYNKLSEKFDNCCFLSNVREMSENKGIECLQNQLISDILKKKWANIRNSDEGTQTIRGMLCEKKVLILLDDVDRNRHMDALAGNRDWFGKGSKLIITTRNKEVLNGREVDGIYEVDVMDPDQSLQLFSKHAFRRDYPLDKDINQSMRAIKIAGGLPLALEVMGSFLSRIKKEKWDFNLAKLEGVSHDDVRSKLKISYDGLENREKHIFLDIACFLIGYDKDIIIHFWESRFYPECAMDVLESMSLIKIKEDNKVWMHDQLRDLGREIVQQINIMEKTRVWNVEEALKLLKRQEKKKNLEALCLHLDHQHRFTYEDFKRLPNLRFLEVCGSKETFRAEERLFWHESPSSVLPTNVFQEKSDLLQQLRWLAWHDIPPTFKITNFSMEDVVILDMSGSRITHDWKGWSHMKVMKNLKVMNLTNCLFLKRTPNFPAHSKLERLILLDCCNLYEIDKSICQLKSLVFLDVSNCYHIRRLPDEMCRDLTNLKYLFMISCKSLERLPNTIGNLKLLIELDICDTRIKELPDSIGNLELLNKLNISQTGIKELPHSIRNLKSLIELDISESEIKELPVSIGNFKLLSELDISSTEIKELPDSIGKLENLKVMKMNQCATRKIPNALWTIEKLEVIEAVGCHFDVEIGNHIYRNRSLRILKLMSGRIYVVPRLPESLTILELSDLYMRTFPNLSNLNNLKELELCFGERDSDGESEGESDGPMEEDPMPLRIGSLHGESDGESDGPVEKDLPRWIGNLSKLESLVLESPYVTALPIDISLLPQLKSLQLWCPKLCCLPSLPSSLSELNMQSKCVAALPMDMSSLLPRLEKLTLYCPNLQCLPSLPSNLFFLHLESECVAALPTDMSSLLRLELLWLQCPNLHCLSSLPSSLGGLYLHNCKSGFSMEDLSNLKTLSSLYIDGCAISEIRGLDRLENLQQLRLTISNCGNLVEIQGGLPPSLYVLEIRRCGSLQKLPDMSSLKGLREVEIKGCGKLNVEAISSLCSKKGVKFKGDETN